MRDFFKKYELSLKGKILLGIILALILGVIIYFVIPKGENVDNLSLDIVEKNQGSIIYDPVNGNVLKLEIAKKAQLSVTISPNDYENAEIEYVVENDEVAYINRNNMIVGKKVGKTRVYAQTSNGKVKSNYIDVEITY